MSPLSSACIAVEFHSLTTAVRRLDGIGWDKDPQLCVPVWPCGQFLRIGAISTPTWTQVETAQIDQVGMFCAHFNFWFGGSRNLRAGKNFLGAPTQ